MMKLMGLKEVVAEAERLGLVFPDEVHDEEDDDYEEHNEYLDMECYLTVLGKPIPVVERPKRERYSLMWGHKDSNKLQEEWNKYDRYIDSKRGKGEGISLRQDQSAFSCAIPEFGEFTWPDGRSPNKKVLDSHWDLLLQYYIAKAKHGYYRCSTPNTEQFAPVIAGLKTVGFDCRAKLPTRHDDDYTVSVWEYVKRKARG